MRIAMVTISYYLQDQRVRREAEALEEVGYDIDVLCLRKKGEPSRSIENDVNVYRIPLERRRGNSFYYIFEYAAFFLLSMIYLSILSIRRRYNFIQIHNMPNILVFITVLPRLFGAKIILDMHDPMPQVYQTQYTVSEDNWMIRLLKYEEYISCRYADYFITVNEPMRKLLLEKNLEPSRIQIVMNCPDPKIFSSHFIHASSSRKKSDLFQIIYTGLLSHRNGLDIAIEAVRILRKEMPDLRLVMYGEGPFLLTLKYLVKKYDLNEQVILKNQIPLDDIPQILPDYMVGISPHRDNVFSKLMFSVKVVEYLTLGLPVICARTDTMKYYFDESMIFYFEPGNALDFANKLRTVRQDPELVAMKINATKEKLKSLDWEEEKKGLLNAFERWGPVTELKGIISQPGEDTNVFKCTRHRER